MRARCSRVLCGIVCVCLPAVGVGKPDSNRLLRSKKSLFSCVLADEHGGEVPWWQVSGEKKYFLYEIWPFLILSCPHTLLWHRAQETLG